MYVIDGGKLGRSQWLGVKVLWVLCYVELIYGSGSTLVLVHVVAMTAGTTWHPQVHLPKGLPAKKSSHQHLRLSPASKAAWP